MQHSQSEVALGTQNGSWADLKHAESLKKRSNTAQNLLFYGFLPYLIYREFDCKCHVPSVVEEQKRLYQELPFMAIPGLRRHSFQRERKFTNLKSRTSWGSFTNLVQVETLLFFSSFSNISQSFFCSEEKSSRCWAKMSFWNRGTLGHCYLPVVSHWWALFNLDTTPVSQEQSIP